MSDDLCNAASNSRPDDGTEGILSRLPVEVLDDILALVSRSTLRACLVVNSIFYTRALPYLYARLRLPCRPPLSDLDSDVCISLPTRSCLGHFRPARHVAQLDIYPHAPAWCQAFAHSTPLPSPTSLPGLDTLRVILPTSAASRALHIQSGGPCAALAPLRPTRLVIRNAPLLYDHVPPHILPAETADTVETAVFVLRPDVALVGTNYKAERRDCGAYGIVTSLPPHVSRLTLVFDTKEGESWRPQPRPLMGYTGDGTSEITVLPIKLSWVGRLMVGLVDELWRLLEERDACKRAAAAATAADMVTPGGHGRSDAAEDGPASGPAAPSDAVPMTAPQVAQSQDPDPDAEPDHTPRSPTPELTLTLVNVASIDPTAVTGPHSPERVHAAVADQLAACIKPAPAWAAGRLVARCVRMEEWRASDEAVGVFDEGEWGWCGR